MTYSNLYFGKKQTTPPLLFFVAAISLVAMIFSFTKTNTASNVKASNKKLVDRQLVNLSPSQAGIYWQTDKAVISWIVYGEKEGQLATMVLDDRDTSTQKAKRKLHYALIKDLEANHSYYYSIVTEEGVYGDAEGKAFTFKTPKNIHLQTTNKPVYGTVLLPNNSPAENVFVFLLFTDRFPLLALTKSKGEFMIPLAYLVDKNHNLIVAIAKDEVNIKIFDEEKKTEVKAYLSQVTPLSRSVVLGKNYDFRSETNVLAANDQVGTSIGGSSRRPTVLYPKENAIISAGKPLIKGLAVPGKKVTIAINSQPPYKTEVKADEKGEWEVVLTKSLSANNYQLNFATEGNKGEKITVLRSFTIGKSGEQVLGSATDSADLTPTPTEIVAPTVPPLTEGGILSPTPTAPTSGSSQNWILFTSAALIMAGIGVILVF